MKRILKAFLVAPVLTLVFAACGGTDTIRIATIGDYEPFNFITTEGELSGMERELGDELCLRAQLECVWVTHDWELMIPGVIDEEFDVILTGMSITDKREESIDFTEPYYPAVPAVYLTLVEAGEDVMNGKIGITANTIYSDYYDEQGLQYVPLDVTVDAAQAVLSGEVDAVLVDHGYAVERIAKHAGELTTVDKGVMFDRGLGIGLRQGSELKDKFNEAIASMKEDGTLNELIIKWLGEEAAIFE